MPRRKEITQIIVQDNAPENINWRGNVASGFTSKRSVLSAMARVATPNGHGGNGMDFFRAVKRGSRWFLQVGQPS
tara:strand:+ start:273 stop:497 length:225 start_codon:yes stop_codon:yes gene_type:complete